MNRTQTKCFALSLLAHGLVVVVFVCTMALSPAPANIDSGEEIKVIDLGKVEIITDAPSSGGGDPAPVTPAPKSNPPPAPKSEPPAPEVKAPPVVKPEPVKIKEPEPAPAPEPVKPADDNWSVVLKPVKDKPKQEKPPEKITLKPVNAKTAKAIKDAEKEAEKKAAEEEAAEQQENQRRAKEAAKAREAYKEGIQKWASTASTSYDGLPGQLSKAGVSVSISGGAGGSGPLSANWRAMVQRIYENYFSPPDSKRNLRTQVTVTVQRDGKVVSDEITKPSGDREYDRAVREALSQVRKLPKFPDDSADFTRTITINFIPPIQRHLE